MNAAIDRWLQAERTLVEGQATEQAAATLPEGQGWILKAMAALEHGTRADIAAVAQAADDAGWPEIRAVLEIALTPPHKVSAKAVRAKARREGLASRSALPLLDLLGRQATATTGAAAPPNAALRTAARGRSILADVLQVLGSDPDTAHTFSDLEATMPRAAQVFASAAVLLRGFPDGPAHLKAHFSPLLVAVHEPVGPDGIALDPELLRRLGRAEPWPDGHDPLGQRLVDTVPVAQRRHLLSLLVRTIAGRIAARRLAGLSGLVHCTAHLAADEGLAELAAQLVWLETALEAVDHAGEVSPDLLQALWPVAGQYLRPAELPSLAVALMDSTPYRAGDPTTTDAMAWLLARHPTHEDLLSMVDEALEAEGVSELLSRAARHGATESRLALLRSLAHVVNENRAEAMAGLGPLLDAGDLQGARALCSAIDTLDDNPRDGGRSRRLARRAFARAAAIGPAAAPVLVHLATWAGPDAPALDLDTWVQETEATGEHSGSLLSLAGALGRSDLARQLVRAEGRRLRSAPQGPTTDDRVLGLLIAAQPPMGLDVGDPFHKVLAPLSAYLLRTGPGASLSAARRLESQRELTPQLVAWYLEHRAELDLDPGWRDVIVARLAPPIPLNQEAMKEVRRVFTSALDGRPTSFGALLTAVAHKLESVVASLLGSDLGAGEDERFDDIPY